MTATQSTAEIAVPRRGCPPAHATPELGPTTHVATGESYRQMKTMWREARLLGTYWPGLANGLACRGSGAAKSTLVGTHRRKYVQLTDFDPFDVIHWYPRTPLARIEAQAVPREPPVWTTNANLRGLTRLRVAVTPRATV
ncbi:hypothetical protein AWC22_04215 [Mycobacterium riyadhense]|uniref:Uncharacterized protein n=1 Tax=Mycobacterium riyadhense TaxID=486698 RepID=A0A1X2BGT3_9MYCO|nr:hypothetical protein [Mycobacterium riyadhense]ORW62429.1 hypothetical protein AWC22_04215 [Mycobacterium riyadhense]